MSFCLLLPLTEHSDLIQFIKHWSKLKDNVELYNMTQLHSVLCLGEVSSFPLEDDILQVAMFLKHNKITFLFLSSLPIYFTVFVLFLITVQSSR